MKKTSNYVMRGSETRGYSVFYVNANGQEIFLKSFVARINAERTMYAWAQSRSVIDKYEWRADEIQARDSMRQ